MTDKERLNLIAGLEYAIRWNESFIDAHTCEIKMKVKPDHYEKDGGGSLARQALAETEGG